MTIDVTTIGPDILNFGNINDTVTDILLDADTLGFGYGLPGPPGDPGHVGPTGSPGPAGPPGPSGGNFRHVQTMPVTTWDIPHNLDFFPNVTVVDSAGGVVEGEIQYIDRNNVRLRFSEAFAGEAYLS